MSGRRPPVAFIAWSSVAGRSQEIARALGGEAFCDYSFGFVDPKLIPLRYLASLVRTIAYLAVRRPRAVIASNPPIFPGLVAYAYGRIMRAPVVLDSHPGAFGLFDSKRAIRLTQPIHRYLIPRVAGSIVTVDELADRVAADGGHAALVHEAPPLWSVRPPAPISGRPAVLFVGIFDDDEPVDVVVDAARELPDVDIRITGDVRKCPPEILDRRPDNVEFVGFLDPEQYRDAVAGADVILTLTDRPEAVNRAANEAVFARRPLIVSDWPTLQRYFPFALHSPNSVEGLVRTIRRAVDKHESLRLETEAAFEAQQQRWTEQLAHLRQMLEPGRARAARTSVSTSGG